MKKIFRVLIIAALLVSAMTAMSFADNGFSIESTYPVSGTKNTTKDNICVKFYFTSDVGNDASKAANADKFQIVDEEGTVIPSRIVYNPDDPKYAIVVVDTTKVETLGKKREGVISILDDTTYTCTISEDFQDNNGNKLGADANRVIEFKTINAGRNTSIYMVMMFVMMGGMFVFSAFQMKKQAEDKKDTDKNVKEEAFNPYKEAKKTGKSVEELIAEHEKEEEKKRKKKAKKSHSIFGSNEDLSDPRRHGLAYRVSKPAPISAAGSGFKTGRKALYEEELKRIEAEKQRRKTEGYEKKSKARAEAARQKNNAKKKGRR